MNARKGASPLRKGFADAARTAFTQYRVQLHRFLVRRLRSLDDAQDLAQDVYVRFLQAPNQDLVRQPQAYLYRIASNVVYEFNLREKYGPVTFDTEAAEEAALGAVETWVDDVGARLTSEQALERVLDQLPPMYKVILVLHKRDGLSYEEISDKLQISEHTVKKYLCRALARCRMAEWEP